MFVSLSSRHSPAPAAPPGEPFSNVPDQPSQRSLGIALKRKATDDVDDDDRQEFKAESVGQVDNVQ